MAVSDLVRRPAALPRQSRSGYAGAARPVLGEIVGVPLIVTPSSGLERRITRTQFERSLPLIDRAGWGPLLEASYNSSYIEAIVDDLRRA